MNSKNSVLTLGTFDGVHRGHQQIIEQVVQRARQRKGLSGVLAFGMPPRHADLPAHERVLLTTLTEKIAILKRLGIQRIQILVFDRKTASIPPDDFFNDTLRDQWGAQEIVVGPRLAFGKNRAGRLPLLKELGKANRIKVHVVPPLSYGGDIISSRKIRRFLSRGSVEKAAHYLGYFYSISGKVIKGDQRGRRLGYPTANILVDPYKILPQGVYWVKVFLGSHAIPLTGQEIGRGIDGLCNVGTRPTFKPNDKSVHCEVFLFQKPLSSLYRKSVRIVFIKRIRNEKRFSGALALQNQIARDFRKAQAWAQGKKRFALQNKLVSV